MAKKDDKQASDDVAAPAAAPEDSPESAELYALAGVIAVDTATAVQAWADKHKVAPDRARRAPVTALALAIGHLCQQQAAPDLVMLAREVLGGHALLVGTVRKLRDKVERETEAERRRRLRRSRGGR